MVSILGGCLWADFAIAFRLKPPYLYSDIVSNSWARKGFGDSMSLPANLTVRCMEKGRLAYFRAKADSEFWDQHWSELLNVQGYDSAKKGELGRFKDIFTRYLPKKGRILEAGCGLGKIVMALQSLGYNCEGVEWAEETVKGVKSLFPDLPIRQGDVCNLPVPGGHYEGYISLGVVEHRREGPEPFLKEASRVLSEEGVLCLSVPWFHGLRRLKALLGFYRGKSSGMEFYQYAYSRDEMSQILMDHGFVIIDAFGYDGYKGLKDEIAILAYLGKRISLIERVIRRLNWLDALFGHMILFVCRKAVHGAE